MMALANKWNALPLSTDSPIYAWSMRFVTTLLGILLLGPMTAQTDTLPALNEQRLEDFVGNAEEDTGFDFNTAFEDLEAYREHPLDLNRASEAELRDLTLLTDVQIANLLSYRQRLNGLLAIYELQAIPGFDLGTIRRVLPFVRVGGDVDDFQASLGQMLAQGENEVYLRWRRILTRQRGFLPLPERPDSTPYLGDPNQFYVRYRHRYSNRLSYGFTAEKDRGEPFFTGANRQGFDYYSAHLFLRDYNQRIRAVALGDFTASMGQGLILFTGFGYGKSALTTSVKRSGRHLRQYTSVNEANFLRGGATTLGLRDNLELTLLASYRRMDGNLNQPDTTETGETVVRFSSLDVDGLHRTAAEIEDRGVIGHFLGGAALKWTQPWGHLAVNAVHHQLDKPLALRPQVYNRYYFQGDRLTNVSLDYNYRWRNFNFFGETARSDNGAIASLNGLLVTLDRWVDLAIVHRSYPRNYHSLLANAFAETDGVRNERGLYVGLQVVPGNHWIISAYYDSWQHPWVRFTTDSPSRGREYRLRFTYWQKRRLEAYLELRNEIKETNTRDLDHPIDRVLPNQRFQARLHFAYQVTRSLEWRSRFDWGFADNPINNRQTGFSMYQDLLFYPIGFPLIFSTRFALFDTDGYQVRFYQYENGLLYNFAIPAYYNQGSRFYLNLRYKGIRNLTLEARFAWLFWNDQESIGSGLEASEGPARSEVGAQVKYQF